MKAFRVTFDIGGTSGLTEILLSKDDTQLEVLLEAKTEKRFIANRPTSKIVNVVELPLSKVKLVDLSVAEFLLLSEI